MRRLPVLAIVSEAIRTVWRNRAAMFRGLIAASLILAALDVAEVHFAKASRSLFLSYAYFVAAVMVYTLFAITCHRIVLLGEASVPRYGLTWWTARETRFVGWLLVSALYAVGMVLALALVFILALAATTGVSSQVGPIESVAIGVGLVPVAYVLGRLAVLFPATAIGERRNTDWAFGITRNNGWRLLIATIAIPAVPNLALSPLHLHEYWLPHFFERLVSCVFLALGLASLSLSFQFLSAEGPGEPGSEKSLPSPSNLA